MCPYGYLDSPVADEEHFKCHKEKAITHERPVNVARFMSSFTCMDNYCCVDNFLFEMYGCLRHSCTSADSDLYFLQL